MTNPSRNSVGTVLVVDDNEPVLQVVIAVLEHANFRVLSATGGKAAMQVAEQTSEHIDLLLSDVDMPVMSGNDLAFLMTGARPDLHVMLMSGGDNGEVMVKNRGWAYIQKPFMPDKLVHVVNEFLHSHA